MNVYEYANQILTSPSLEDKLVSSNIITSYDFVRTNHGLESLVPNRESKIKFSADQFKFPKTGSFHLDDKKAQALHFFANHELLAIEMMAAALNYIPTHDEKLYKKIAMGLVGTIEDEIKHFKLYRSRMNDYGVDFGDLPVNDFFWRQMQKIKSYDEYFAVMALTFEAGNLDFAKFYRDVFKNVGDEKSSNVLNIVYEDEISHVGLGVHWLNRWRGDKTLWQYYVTSLPDLISPARSKGKIFDREGRVRTGMDEDFITRINDYSDDFKITNRKEWK